MHDKVKCIFIILGDFKSTKFVWRNGHQVQLNTDSSNLQGKSKKISSYQELGTNDRKSGNTSVNRVCFNAL